MEVKYLPPTTIISDFARQHDFRLSHADVTHFRQWAVVASGFLASPRKVTIHNTFDAVTIPNATGYRQFQYFGRWNTCQADADETLD